MVNEKLRNARLKQRWTQEVAAAKIGVARKTYLKWEQGEQVPHLTTLDMACEAFGLSPEELGFEHPSMPSGEDMDQKRRLILKGAAGLLVGSAAVAPTVIDPKGIDETIRDHFEGLTKLCWNLLKADGLPTVEQLLPTFVPSLEALARQPSKHQKTFAGLASQGCLLAGLVAVLQMNMNTAESYCQQAVVYSRIAEDCNLEVAALKHLATKYSDARYPRKTLQIYQEALPLVDQVSPLLQSRTYLGLALAYAQCGQKQESLYHLDLAEDTFPEHPQDDPAFAYADCGPSSLNHYGGLIRLEFDQPKAAWETFASVGALTSKIVIPKRTLIEINNCQAEAALAERSLELACHHVQVGVTGAHELKSEKRFDDACTIYKQMRLVWPHEPQVKALAGLFHR